MTFQRPIAGDTVPAGSAVNLILSGDAVLLPVPDLTGIAAGNAFDFLVAAGFLPSIGFMHIYNGTVPEGQIFEQDPAAGTNALSDGFFLLTVSRGPVPDMVNMPDLSGFTQSEAESRIVEEALEVGTVTTEHSDTVLEGQVIRQTPAAGTTVEPGTSVHLVISLGPAPNRPPVFVSVPVTEAIVGELYEYQLDATDPDSDPLVFTFGPFVDLVMVLDGVGLVSAILTLREAGLRTVTFRVSDPEGLFDDQSFTIAVRIRTPDVTGLPQGGAEQDITDQRLVGTVTTAPSDTVPAGTVISQSPAAGTPLLPGEAVNLVVSRGPNNKPIIDSVPINSAQVGVSYTYDVNATDADGDPLTFSLNEAPAGMSIDPATGLIQWTPASDQEGVTSAVVQVSDPFGGVAVQGFTILVQPP